MVDLVDYVENMKATMPVYEKVKPAKAPAAGVGEGVEEYRLREVEKLLLATMREKTSSTLQEILADVSSHGYTDVELKAILNVRLQSCLPRREISKRGAPRTRITISRTPVPTVKPKPFDPQAAGRQVVEKLQAAEGGAWTGQELNALFKLTSANLHKRRTEHRIIYWRDARHNFH